MIIVSNFPKNSHLCSLRWKIWWLNSSDLWKHENGHRIEYVLTKCNPLNPFARVWSLDQNENAEKHRRHQLDSKTWSKLVWGYRRLDFFLKHLPEGQSHPRRDRRPRSLATCPNTSDKQVPNNCQMDVSLLVNIPWTLLSIRGKIWLSLRPIQIFRHVAASCIYPPICLGNANICVCWYHPPKRRYYYFSKDNDMNF